MQPETPMVTPRLRALSLMLATVLVLVAFVEPGELLAQGAERPKVERVTLDFHDAPMIDVVQFFSNLLQENYIIASDLDASRPLTVIAPRAVSKREARVVFEVALSSNGLAMVRMGSFTKIVSAKDATGPVGERRGGSHAKAGTHLVELRYASVGDLAPVLERLNEGSVKIVPYPRTNALIVVGSEADFGRVRQIIGALDRPGEAAGIHIYELQHADAEELSRSLEALAR